MLKAVLILLFAGGAVWFFYQPRQLPITAPQVEKTNSEYEDSEYKFKLIYPLDFEVTNETEDEYSERTKTKFRKNFNYYVTYEPPKLVKGLVVKKKDTALTEDQFAQVPFYLWIFENPDNLTSEKWYVKYWYYPFFWGVYDMRKAQIEPSSLATVSGILAKSAEVYYSPGKPKLILLPKDDKMYLFKIMEGGQDLLESFKFL